MTLYELTEIAREHGLDAVALLIEQTELPTGYTLDGDVLVLPPSAIVES